MKRLIRKIFLVIVFVILFTSLGCQAATRNASFTEQPVASPTPGVVQPISPTETMSPTPTRPAPTPTSQVTPTALSAKLDFRDHPKIILAADPNIPGKLYIHIPDNKIYQSMDGGNQWKVLSEPEIKQVPPSLLNSFMQSESIPVLRRMLAPGIAPALLAVDPLSGTLYAVDETASNLVASSDGGNTWSPIGPLPMLTPEGILAVDPVKAGRLYLVNMGGIYRSEDGGKTWMNSSTGIRQPGPSGYMFTQIIFHPQITTTLYLTGPGDYTYVSTNSGENWTEIRLPEADNFHQGIGGLFLDPHSDKSLYAINNFPPPDLRLYQSNDGGQEWVETNFELPDGELRYLLIDPFEASVRYIILGAGEFSGFYKSEDGGATWSEIETGLVP